MPDVENVQVGRPELDRPMNMDLPQHSPVNECAAGEPTGGVHGRQGSGRQQRRHDPPLIEPDLLRRIDISGHTRERNPELLEGLGGQLLVEQLLQT